MLSISKMAGRSVGNQWEFEGEQGMEESGVRFFSRLWWLVGLAPAGCCLSGVMSLFARVCLCVCHLSDIYTHVHLIWRKRVGGRVVCLTRAGKSGKWQFLLKRAVSSPLKKVSRGDSAPGVKVSAARSGHK